MTLAERLATLRPQCENVDPEKGAGIEYYRFAEALAGPGPRGGSVNGSVLVSNAKRRYDAQIPNERSYAWPRVFKARVEGGRDPCNLFEPRALVDTIRCVLLPQRVTRILQSTNDVEALRALLRRHANGEALQEALDNLDAAVQLTAQDVQAVSALTGASSQNIRWTRCPDIGPEILASSDDLFRALGVEHPRQDWHDWLKRDYEEAIQNEGLHRSLDLNGAADHIETPIVLKKVLLGHPEPVRIINRNAYRIMVGCYIRRGRLPSAQIQMAWDLFERVNVGDRRVIQNIEANAAATSSVAKEFVLGATEATRQALVQRNEVPRTLNDPRPMKKRSPDAISAEMPGSPLTEIISEHAPAVSPKERALLIKVISGNLVKAIAQETGRLQTTVAAQICANGTGKRTMVPNEYKDLAKAVLLDHLSRQVEGAAIPRHGPPSVIVDAPPMKRRRVKTGFLAASARHIAAKKQANALFVTCLTDMPVEFSQPIFVLDAFAEVSGFELRSTMALKAAGFQKVFIANPDQGICQAARTENCTVFQGTWEEAALEWAPSKVRFGGLYLDLCSGSDDYVTRQMQLATGLSASSAVLAVTLLQRDQGGKPFSDRVLRLVDSFLLQGWTPARMGMSSSSVSYVTTSGQCAITLVMSRRH